MSLLPPAADACQECAVKHGPDEPHDPQSLFWQTKRNLEGLPPATWEDALAHCPPEVKEAWKRVLKDEYGFGCSQCGGWKFNKDDYICKECRSADIA
jgi:hypothetical protein